MKKLFLLAVLGLAGIAFAASYEGSGTTYPTKEIVVYKSIHATDDLTLHGVAIPTSVVAQVGGTVTATSVTAIAATWVKITNVFDNVTNIIYAPTAVPTATTTINVLSGAGFVTNVLIRR